MWVCDTEIWLSMPAVRTLTPGKTVVQITTVKIAVNSLSFNHSKCIPNYCTNHNFRESLY